MHTTTVAVATKRAVELSKTIKVYDMGVTFVGVFPDMATALMVLAPYWPSK